jgi:hypothetical protein
MSAMLLAEPTGMDSNNQEVEPRGHPDPAVQMRSGQDPAGIEPGPSAGDRGPGLRSPSAKVVYLPRRSATDVPTRGVGGSLANALRRLHESRVRWGATVFWASLVLAGVAALGTNSLLAVGSLVVAGLALLAHLSARRTIEEIRGAAQADGWGVLNAELRRARRHGRRLTLCLIRLPDPGVVRGVAQVVGRALRTDDTAFTSDDKLYVILPEIGGESAQVPLGRLNGLLADIGARGSATLATYPDDALTVPGLVAHLLAEPDRVVGAGAPVTASSIVAEAANTGSEG